MSSAHSLKIYRVPFRTYLSDAHVSCKNQYLQLSKKNHVKNFVFFMVTPAYLHAQHLLPST